MTGSFARPALVVALGLIAPLSAADASPCDPHSHCERYWRADVVFVGTVTDVRCPAPGYFVGMLSEVGVSVEAELETVTDASGAFRFAAIAERPYQVTATLEEGDSLYVARTRVRAGSDEPVIIRLESLTP